MATRRTRSPLPRLILDAALELFNAHGDSGVSTNDIANELGISPGNLHYHFRRREDLVLALFEAYERRIMEILLAGESGPVDLDLAWFRLHLLFEAVWDYRFFYREPVTLTGRYPPLRRGMRRLLDHKARLARHTCESLIEAGLMHAGPEETGYVATELSLTLTFWFGYVDLVAPETEPAVRLRRGARQVLAGLAPYLEPVAQDHLRELATAYADGD
jgi:AcrR family transcriptional regulator